MPQELGTPVAKTRLSCESSDSRHSNTSRISMDSLGQKTRNFVHGIRNRFSTDALNAEHDDGTTSLPTSPAKHRWWKSLRSRGVTSHNSVMTIPWVGPTAATVRYGASPHKALDFGSLGKASQRESLPDRLPLMFTTSTPDEDGVSKADMSGLSHSGSLHRGKSCVGTPPKLEIPGAVELGSDTLGSFREMSEQAIQDIEEKYDKGESPQLNSGKTREKGATLEEKAAPRQPLSTVTASIDEVLATANTTNTLAEVAQSKLWGPEYQGTTADREFPIHPSIGSDFDSKQAESQETSPCIPEDTSPEGIVQILSKEGVNTQYPTCGFWQRHGEITEHRNGEEALIDFLHRNQHQLWSNQLLYHESQAILLALPPWVIVDRQKLNFRSWTWASLEVFPIGDEFLSGSRLAKNMTVDIERGDTSLFGKTHGRQNRGAISEQEQEDDCSPVAHRQSDYKNRKHVSFSEKIQVLNDPDEGSLADNEDDSESSINDDLTDSADEDERCCRIGGGPGNGEVLSEIKNPNDEDMRDEHSISSHGGNGLQVKALGPKLRRSTTSVQKLQVDALSRREDDLENMSPIELEDMDLDMAKRLDGRH